MRHFLLVAGGVVIGGALFYLEARSDYRWAEANIVQEREEGWTLAATNNNFVTITRPWTLFRPPITGLWFVKLTERVPLAPNIFVIPQVSQHFDYNKTEQIEGLVAYDVANHRSAFLGKGVEASQLKVDRLEWRTFARNTPGAKVQAFVEAALSSGATH